MNIVCPKCGTGLAVTDVQPGDRIVCGSCGTVLHVPAIAGAGRRPAAGTAPWVWFVVAGVAAVALAGAGIGIGLYLGRSPASPELSPGVRPTSAPPLPVAATPAAKPTPASLTPAATPTPAKPPAPAPAPADDGPPTYERVLPSVPVVTAMPLVGLGRGSGFLIEYDSHLYIVTNRHVVNAAERGFTLSFHKPGSEGLSDALNLPVDRSALTLVHKTADLALLDMTDFRREIEGRNIQPLKLSDVAHPPKVMGQVWAFGHPVAGGGMALDNTVTSGTISRIGDVPGYGLCVGITAAIGPGNSGGPILDERSRVVGIVCFGIRGMDRGNFALHVDTLRELLTNPAVRMSETEIANLLKTPEELVKAEQAGRKIMSEIVPEATRIARILEQEGYHPVPWNEGRNTAFYTMDPKAAQSLSFGVTDGQKYAVMILGPRGAVLKTTVIAGKDAQPAQLAESEAGRLTRLTAKGTGTCQVNIRNDGAEKSLVIVLIMGK